jgi:peptidyl-prolyl cis-trans isomerase-like 4
VDLKNLYEERYGSDMENVEKKILAKARAEALVALGDIPDAELAPPDNVLFVCKLHKVTSSQDLEPLFS